MSMHEWRAFSRCRTTPAVLAACLLSVTVTGINAKGSGAPTTQTIKLTVPNPCANKPPAQVTKLAADAIDHKTLVSVAQAHPATRIAVSLLPAGAPESWC